MRVREIMTPAVTWVGASTNISHAARRMANDDVGGLPVLSERKLVGIVTDRDIIVRAIAKEVPLGASVCSIMTENVATCAPEDDVETALALMSREQIRRMPVCNAEGELVGIITLADTALRAPDKESVAATLADICEPYGQHDQAALYG